MGIDFNQLNNLIADYYNAGEWVEQTQKDNLISAMNSLFDEMDKEGNNNGKLDKGDGLKDIYNDFFGITDSRSLTKSELRNKIDDIVNKIAEERTSLSEDYRRSDFETLAQKKQREINEGMSARGKYVFEKLSGETTNGTYYTTVDSYLKETNKNNVMDFLKGFYEGANSVSWYNPAEWGNRNELIERFDDEYDGGLITKEAKLHLIDSVLKKAEDMNLKTNPYYVELLSIYKTYSTGGENENKKDFNNGDVSLTRIVEGAAAGAATGAVVGAAASSWAACIGALPGAIVGGIGGAITGAVNRRTDNEIIDECIRNLFDEINKNLNK